MNRTSYCVFAIIVFCSSIANAAIIAQFELEGQTTVQPGGSTAISVYFRETTTAGTPSILSNPNGGLVNANFSISRSLSTGNNRITSTTANPVFNDALPLTIAADGSSADFPLYTLTNSPTGVASGPNSFRILLGTFNVTGGPAGSTATFSTVQPGEFDFLLGDGVNDTGPLYVGLQLAPTSISVTAVPEPTSVLLLLPFAVGAAVVCWRKKLSAR
jgi:hypothetical protein